MSSIVQSDTVYNLDEILDRTPKEGYGFIYLYILDNGMMYVGQTTYKMRRRHYFHIKGVQVFDRFLRKHDFILKIIEEIKIDELVEREIFNILKYNTLLPIGLNVVLPTEGCSYIATQYTRDLHSKISTEKWKDDTYRNKVINGQKNSIAWNEYISTRASQRQKKVWSDPELRARHSAILKEVSNRPETKEKRKKYYDTHNGYWLGKKMSKESNLKKSETHKKIGISEEVFEKMCESNRENNKIKLDLYLDWEWNMTQGIVEDFPDLSTTHIREIRLGSIYTSN